MCHLFYLHMFLCNLSCLIMLNVHYSMPFDNTYAYLSFVLKFLYHSILTPDFPKCNFFFSVCFRFTFFIFKHISVSLSLKLLVSQSKFSHMTLRWCFCNFPKFLLQSLSIINHFTNNTILISFWIISMSLERTFSDVHSWVSPPHEK